MKSTAISMLATFALLLATPALAQESSRADFEEYIEAFRGRWVGRVPLPRTCRASEIRET